MNKVDRHMDICKGLNKIYEQKNHDYGDSFHDTFVEEGMAMARIRLSDKLNRFKKLSKAGSEQKVNDESIRDTLLDLANYSIMTVMEMDILAEEEHHNNLMNLGSDSLPWNGYGKRFGLHFDRGADITCPRCGNVLKYDTEKSNEKDDIYFCERCGMLCRVDIEHDCKIPITEEELKKPEEENKGERLWEKIRNMKDECEAAFTRYACPVCGGFMAFEKELDRYVCEDCGATYGVKASNGKPDTDRDQYEQAK